MKIQIAPSLLSGDFGQLAEEAKKAEKGGADLIHVDVMDGHFVPNITIGPDMVRSLRKATRLPLDVHLMINRPDIYAEAFIQAGADMVSVHVEAPHPIEETTQKIKNLGAKCGIVFNPKTSFNLSDSLLKKIDYILIMSVNPGFGGQKFIEEVLPKVSQARAYLKEKGKECDIEVDGGISPENAGRAVASGANILVAGSSIFGKTDIAKAIQNLREAAKAPTA